MNLTTAYITALTGSPDTVMDWRVIHDRDKGEQGRNLRGSLSEMLPTLQQYNQAGWGVFMTVNAMDGQGQSLPNVAAIRAHFADLDDPLNSHAAYQQAVNSVMPPQMAVQTSEGKFHLYWLVEPYAGNDFFTLQQKKLAQLFNGDKSVNDATRVLRVPGFYHMKSDTPQLVTCWQVAARPRYTHEQIAAWLEPVNVIERYSTRAPLGDPKLAAPDWNSLMVALWDINPNDLDRDSWMATSAAFKQAGWTLAPEPILLEAWQKWCAQYNGNDAERENMKLWNSFHDTQVGWGRFKRVTNVDAYQMFGPTGNAMTDSTAVPTPTPVQQQPLSTDAPPKPVLKEDILDGALCREWFAGCYFIERLGKIYTPSGRYMNSTQFNGAYGGKQFLMADGGTKVVREAWTAALQSSLWTIPKVDHIRFLPRLEPLTIVEDKRGRLGLNTYKPARVDAVEGDASPFINHWARLIPDQNDLAIFIAYLAHCVKYPGAKIPWAVFFQSTQGTGKTMIYELLRHALGEMYVYKPNARELAGGGSKFNAWMREQLMIVVDEIKVDDKRELSEVLKPLITDAEVEVQGKGVDQDKEDNAANWIFFSNFEDAIPIDDDDRRYAMFLSAFQTKADLERAGMGDDYFRSLYNWLQNENGYAIITHWLLQHPITLDGLPVRAPVTTSHARAVEISKSPFEVLLDEMIEHKAYGFKGGYVSMTVLMRVMSERKLRTPPQHVIQRALMKRGYVKLGYTPAPVPGEDMARGSLIYAVDSAMDVEGYQGAQM